jgi:hypothetical protein
MGRERGELGERGANTPEDTLAVSRRRTNERYSRPFASFASFAFSGKFPFDWPRRMLTRAPLRPAAVCSDFCSRLPVGGEKRLIFPAVPRETVHTARSGLPLWRSSR